MTWKILVDQIKRVLAGSNPSSPAIWDEEIKAYAKQVINTLLNTSYFQTVLPSGDTIPDGYVMAVYTGIPVERWQKKSRAKLPAYPIRLPKNMGVFLVAKNDDEEDQFIPVPSGQSGFIKSQGLMSNLIGKVGYEVKDGYVVFTKDIDDELVQMHLVVMDFDHYTDTQILPIPAEMTKTVVEEVVKLYSVHATSDKLIDSNTEPTKLIKQ
jgi:hypothetical protein